MQSILVLLNHEFAQAGLQIMVIGYDFWYAFYKKSPPSGS